MVLSSAFGLVGGQRAAVLMTLSRRNTDYARTLSPGEVSLAVLRGSVDHCLPRELVKVVGRLSAVLEATPGQPIRTTSHFGVGSQQDRDKAQTASATQPCAVY